MDAATIDVDAMITERDLLCEPEQGGGQKYFDRVGRQMEEGHRLSELHRLSPSPVNIFEQIAANVLNRDFENGVEANPNIQSRYRLDGAGVARPERGGAKSWYVGCPNVI